MVCVVCLIYYNPRCVLFVILINEQVDRGSSRGREEFLRREQEVLGGVREARRRRYLSNYAEFKKIATSCAIGFAIMGGIGYIVKLLFIPINNIILS